MTTRLFTSARAVPSEPARLGRGFALLLLLLALVAGLGLYELHALGSRQQAQASLDAGRTRQAQELRVAIGQAGLLVRQALLPADSAAATALQLRLAEAQDRAAVLELALRSGAGAAAPAWLASQLDELGRARSQTVQLHAEALQQSRDGHQPEALRTLATRAEVAEARWLSQADELLRQLDLQAQAAQVQTQEARQRQLLQFFAWSLTALLLGALLAWSAVQRLREALERGLRTVASEAPSHAAASATARSATAVADLAPPAAAGRGARAGAGVPLNPVLPRPDRAAGTLKVSRRSADAGGGDGSAFDRLAGSLTRAGSEAMAPAPRPNAAPAAVGADLSTPPATVAGPVQPASLASGNLSATVPSDRPCDEVVRDAVAAATRGGLVVSQVVANIEDIGATGRRIAETVALIDSIAFQTNLLALNAVVEAAHSEARSGAVLPGVIPGAARVPSATAGAAADVRSLAQRATQAAREIKALITAGASASAAGGSSPTASGLTAALQQDASQTMDALLTSVQQAAELVTQVRRAAESQAPAGVVAESMEQLDRMQRNHTALVEQSAASAEALRLQAERLQKVLGAFKLLQQTQQAAWGAHTAIRSASERSRQPDSGFGGLVKPGDEPPASGGWTSF
jgi:hypothetical protein